MRYNLQTARLAMISLCSALILTMTFSYSLASFADTAQKTKAHMDARAEPYFDNSEIKGFRLTRIRENSVYAKAGLVNNDIIQSINGKALQNAESAVELLNALRSDAPITLKILRGGAKIDLTLVPQTVQ